MNSTNYSVYFIAALLLASFSLRSSAQETEEKKWYPQVGEKRSWYPQVGEKRSWYPQVGEKKRNWYPTMDDKREDEEEEKKYWDPLRGY